MTLWTCVLADLPAARLPHGYYQLLANGMAEVQTQLAAHPGAGLAELETHPGFRHFPSAILMAAVLYGKAHPANPRYQDPRTLETALSIGDLLAAEQEQGTFSAALDRHRDSYMWLEAYRVLEARLGEERRARWRRALIDYLTPLAAEVSARRDYPWYTARHSRNQTGGPHSVDT